MLQDALTLAFDVASFGGLAWMATAFCLTVSKPRATENKWMEPIELPEALPADDCPDLFETFEPTTPEPTTTTPNLTKKSVKELRNLCRDRQIQCKLWKSARKEQLIALLNPPLISRSQPKAHPRHNHRLHGLRVG